MSRHREDLDSQTFGERVKTAREGKGWTQPQLARAVYEATGGRVDLTASEISRYERGRVKSPRLEVTAALAASLGQPLGHFTGGQDLADRLAALEATVDRILDLNERSFEVIADRFDRLERRLDALGEQADRRSRGA